MNTPVTFILDGIWGRCERWQPLRRRIENSAGPCEIYPYDNSGRTSIECVGMYLSNHLLTLRRPFNLVGYSMGGLVIREAIRQQPDLPLQRAAFLHSPHRGSLAAWLRPDLVACREMRPGSEFLQRLEAWQWTRPTLVTWSAGDLMILPGSSACWAKASVVMKSPVPAHAWPVISSGIHSAVSSFLSVEATSRLRIAPPSL